MEFTTSIKDDKCPCKTCLFTSCNGANVECDAFKEFYNNGFNICEKCVPAETKCRTWAENFVNEYNKKMGYK